MNLIASYADDTDDANPDPPSSASSTPAATLKASVDKEAPPKKRKKLSVQALMKSTTALLSKGPPAGMAPAEASTNAPEVVTVAKFCPTALEKEIEEEFRQEEAERVKEDMLSTFLDECTREPEKPAAPKAPAVNSEREEMIQALFNVGPKQGPAAMPPPEARPKPKAKGKETIWQQESRKQQFGQATYTLKTNRDCPDIWQGGTGEGKKAESVKQRTHRKLKQGQSEWRTESAHGAWKTEEEMQLRNYYDS